MTKTWNTSISRTKQLVQSGYIPLPPQHSKLRHKSLQTLTNRLTAMAAETLMAYAPKMEQKYLYQLLIPSEDFEIMLNASTRMLPVANTWMMDNIKLMTQINPNFSKLLEYSISYNAEQRIRWLWPMNLNTIKRETELGQHLLPLIDIAIQWKTTIKLLELMFTQVSSMSLIVHMLPWLRLIITPELTKYSTIQEKNYLNKIKNVGTPRYIPGVSKWFGEVCRYGLELVSLYSIVKRGPVSLPFTSAIITPVLNDDLIETELTDHFNDFYNNSVPPLPSE